MYLFAAQVDILASSQLQTVLIVDYDHLVLKQLNDFVINSIIAPRELNVTQGLILVNHEVAS